MSDFDKIPKPVEPPYKYFKPLPKKRSERRQLEAHTCPNCEKYYSQLDPSRVQESSRHRGPARPPTPEWFWELGFPDDYNIPLEKIEKRQRLNKYDKLTKYADDSVNHIDKKK